MMSLPSEISDLAKQLQAKLGEALPKDRHFSLELDWDEVGPKWTLYVAMPDGGYASAVGSEVGTLVAAAMEREKGAGK
jgi:hypothetical protein